MSAVSDPIILRQISLFHGLKHSQLSRLNELMCSEKVAPGFSIINADEPANKKDEEKKAYIIHHGTVKVYIDDPYKRNVTLAILGSGQIVGEMSLVDTIGRSASVVTLEESALLLIRHSDLQKCLRRMPILACNLMHVLASRLRLADLRIQSLATLKVRGRVARQILAFAEEYGKPARDGHTCISLSLTPNDLADLVGSNTVSVYQALAEYKRKRWISIEQKRYITVLDGAALSSAANDEN